MTRRRGMILGLVVLVVAGLVVWFDPWPRLQGWFASEPFLAGYPARVWSERLASSDELIQARAVEQVRDQGVASVPVLVALLHADQPATARWRAAELLGYQQGKAAPAVPALLAVTTDEDTILAAMALRALSKIAPDRPEVIQAVVPLLHGSLRAEGLHVLNQAATVSPPSVQPALTGLVGMLVKGEPADRMAAAEVLARMKGTASDAVPGLVRALGDPEPAVRAAVAEAIGRVAKPEPTAREALESKLDDASGEVRAAAARSLGWFGPAAQASVPLLRKHADDADEQVRQRIKQALGRIAPGEAK